MTSFSLQKHGTPRKWRDSNTAVEIYTFQELW